MRKKTTLTIIKIFSLCLLFLTVNTIHAQQGDNGTIDVPGDIAIIAFNKVSPPTSKSDYAFLLLDDCTNGTTIVFDDDEWTGSAFDSPIGEGANTWINDTGSTIPKGTVIQISSGNDLPTASIGSVTESDSGFNLAAGDQIYAYFGTRAAPTTFLAFYGELAPTNGEIAVLAGTGLVAGSTAVSSSNLGYYSGSTVCNGSTADCLNAISNPPAGWTTGEFNFPTGVPSTFTGSTFAAPNTAPVIAGTSAGQAVNDNATVSPFSAITTTDADGDNLSATITLDVNAKGVLSGTGLTGAGPYAISSTTPADLQAKLRALSYNPTDNRTSTSETTTFTLVIDDGKDTDTDNLTTVVSNAVAPTVSNVTVPSNATYVAGQNLDFTVNFNENITVVTTGGNPQITITVGAIVRQATYISGSGSSALLFRYTVQNGDLDTDGITVGTLATNGGTLADSGNANANTTLNSIGATTNVLVDAAGPTVTNVSIPNSPANVDDAITVIIVTDESGLTLNTGQVNGVNVTGFTNIAGNTYSATYTVAEGNTDRAAGDNIPVNFILTDALGNNSAAFTTAISQASDPIDANSPSVISTSIPDTSAKVGDAITVSLTASEAGLSLNTGQVNGAFVTEFSDDGGGSYSATYTVAEGNTDRAAGDNIPVNFILSDAAGNNSAAFTTAISQASDPIDANTPTVSSASIPNTSAKVGDAITVSLTASEAGLSLNTGQVNGVNVTGFSDDGGGSYSATYTVAEGNTDRAAGDNIPVNFILSDAAGNNSASFTTAISQASDPIDANTPTVSSVTVPANATYIAGQNLDFTVNFNENITVVTAGGTPQIAITIGATVRQANYIAGSGSSAVLFRYTVQNGDLDTDGIAVGALATNGGTLRDNANNNANITLNSVGSTANVFVGNPTLTWTGITNNDWNTASNWNTNSVPTSTANVTIPSGLTNYPTISSAVTVNSINIASAASLIANATVTAPVTYKRNLPTTNWYLVAAPVNGETQQDVIANHTFATGTGSNIGLGSYLNNAGPSWMYSTNASTGAIPSGVGISMKLAAPGDVSITGSINTSNVSFPVNQGTRDNFNLLGNPYTAYINSATFTSTNTATLTEETIWLWNGTQYVTYNAVSPINLAPGQGFFVEASGSGNVTYSTANQSHQNSDTFMRQAPKTSFELFVENDGNKKSTKVFYVANKTTGFDNGYDSKMFSGVKEDFSIYTELLENNQGKKLAIQTLPNTNLETLVIPVGVTIEAGKELTFSVSSKNLPDGMEVYLEDRKAKTFTNLSHNTYKVIIKNTTKSTGQFYIHISSKKLENIPTKQELQNVSIYRSTNNTLTVAGLQTDNASLNIYSILGKKIISTQFKSTGTHVIQLPEISKGVYIVELKSDLGKISKKIILE